MPIGTTAALLIGAGISGAGQVAASKVASNANKKAVEAQTQAGQNSMNLQREQLQQTRSDLSPYMQVGRGALTNLAGMTGIAAPTDAPMAPQGAMGPQTPQGPSPLQNWLKSLGGDAQPDGDLKVKLQNLGRGSSYVKMTAPDGSVEDVDPQHVSHYEQLGGRRL